MWPALSSRAPAARTAPGRSPQQAQLLHGDFPATRALLRQHLVFGHLRRRGRRGLEHLHLLHPAGRDIGQVPPAAAARHRAAHHGPARAGGLPERGGRGAPGCLPGLRPDLRRSDRSFGSLVYGLSDKEGGLDDVEESLARRRSSSSTRAASASARARSAATARRPLHRAPPRPRAAGCSPSPAPRPGHAASPPDQMGAYRAYRARAVVHQAPAAGDQGDTPGRLSKISSPCLPRAPRQHPRPLRLNSYTPSTPAKPQAGAPRILIFLVPGFRRADGCPARQERTALAKGPLATCKSRVARRCRDIKRQNIEVCHE